MLKYFKVVKAVKVDTMKMDTYFENIVKRTDFKPVLPYSGFDPKKCNP